MQIYSEQVTAEDAEDAEITQRTPNSLCALCVFGGEFYFKLNCYLF